MKLREAILWQPGSAGRFGILCASATLALLLAYLHTLAGLAYEFHVFFAPPLALVAWFLGLRWGMALAVLVVARMSPLEFMQRLAALVPRPRLHLIRFHGVLAPNAGLRAAIVPGSPEKRGDDAAHNAHGAPARMGWARLLKRVFGIDLEHCPQCGGDLTIIAAIEEPAVIVKILTHLGLPARAPPRSPARALPLFQAA